MKPTSNRILILGDKPRDKTTSGILIKEDWKSVPPKGTVLAVGPKVTTVKKGDRVLFERYASVILDDNERMCLEDHILAIIDE
ncbi:MAG: co-chaperone GroES [Candidatus Thorarchaeota archaeon]|jgi:chaperonin GroES